MDAVDDVGLELFAGLGALLRIGQSFEIRNSLRMMLTRMQMPAMQMMHEESHPTVAFSSDSMTAWRRASKRYLSLTLVEVGTTALTDGSQ
jgi:hypothetical protein